MVSHKYNEHFLHNIFLNFDNVGKLTIMHTIKTFASGMISLFIPIFLYLKGYSLIEIVLYEGFLFLMFLLFNPLFLKINSKIGIKKAIIISVFFQAIYFLVLYSADILVVNYKYLFLFVILVLVTIYEQFYWMAFHLDFTLNFSQKKEGKQLGLLSSLPAFLSLFSPLIGGFLITTYSFTLVFLIVLFLILISLVPIIFFENQKANLNLDFNKILNFKEGKLNFLYFIDGIHNVAVGFIWPLFLFLLKIVLSSIGLIYTFSSFLSSISNYYGAKFSNDENRRRIFKTSSLFFGATISLRPLYNSLNYFVFFHGIGSLAAPFFLMSFNSYYYKIAKKDPINRIANREVYLNLGRFSGFMIIFILLLFLSPLLALISFIVFGGFMTIFSYVLNKAIN